jgi:hypothetical protein
MKNIHTNKQHLCLIINHLALCGFSLIYNKSKDDNYIAIHISTDSDTEINIIKDDECSLELLSIECLLNKHIPTNIFLERINEIESTLSIGRLKLIPEFKAIIDQYSLMA